MGEKNKTETKVLEKRVSLTSIMEAIPVGMVVFDSDGLVLYANRRSEKILGRSADALTEKGCDAVFGCGHRPSDRREAEGFDACTSCPLYGATSVSARNAPREAVFEGEIQIAPGSGATPGWIKYSVNRFAVGPEQVAAMSIEEITPYKAAVEDLRLKSLVLDQIKDQVTITDLRGVITYVNQAEAQTMRLSRPALLGQPTAVFGEDPEQGATQEEILRKTLQEGSWRGDVVNITADGRKRIMDCRTQVVHDPQGNPVALCGVSTDITERKVTEQLLAQSHDLLQNLTRLVPGVVYQYRLYPDGRSAFPYASPGMNTIYEVAPEEVREDAAPVFGRLHPEDHDRVAEAIFASARTLETFYCEFRVVLPRQGTRWRWSQAQPQRMPDGGTLWHGIISDITDLKQAEQERSRLHAQLQQAQKMEAVGRLAGGVAHDINNMLSVIMGYTEMAVDNVQPQTPLHASLTEIFKAARHSAEVTRQLLAFARKQTIDPKVVDLNAIVESMLKMLRRLIGEDIDLEWQPGQALWAVKIDPSQVDQILANLCINARDAIAGIGKVTIATCNTTVDAAFCETHGGLTPGEFVVLTVSDDGCGMEAKTLENIFEPFFTTKTMDEGTGLGLATVYGIVNQNNGFIQVSSEPGRGTTFAIYLHRHDQPAQPTATPKPSATPRSLGEIVLLVEDESAIMKMAQVMLERLGYTVLAAGTPKQAIALADEYAGQIDLLITDVVMPEMNGRELSHLLGGRHRGLKTLFMSGYTADLIAHRGVLEQGMHFIHKPFSVKELGIKVRAVLDEAVPTASMP